ncbi:threonine synthase [Natronorarus salvus]|uniref:threonine synthase n=1 Tax=Natronorarus salvus TaxID=3117733 RepID=UPI002F2610D0
MDLVCYACGERSEPISRTRCSCGEPLWIDVPAPSTWPASSDPGMWRYERVLPTDVPSGVGAAAGGTPLVRTPAFDAEGVGTYVKDEGQNPTGSFKDRGSAVGVAAVAAGGGTRVGTVSHGNMAMSVAAHAAAHGLDCTVLVPADISDERLSNIARYDPEILRVQGDYGDLYRRTLSPGVETPFLNSDTPLRVAGQKTTAYEICEAFSPSVPDAIVLPVSSGGHLSGLWKALRELQAGGLLDRLPRLYAVQAAACDPIVRAFEAGETAVSGIEKRETVAYSIANADPPSGNRALAALRATDGGAVSVREDEIREAQRRFARDGGFRVEASSAVTLAGVSRLRERGEIREGEDAVLVVTGSGFKESIEADVDAETIDLSDLDRRLS